MKNELNKIIEGLCGLFKKAKLFDKIEANVLFEKKKKKFTRVST